MQLDPNLGTVRMDSTQAQQILLNLVLNARDALPEDDRIMLETRNCGLQIVTVQRGGEDGSSRTAVRSICGQQQWSGDGLANSITCFRGFLLHETPG